MSQKYNPEEFSKGIWKALEINAIEPDAIEMILRNGLEKALPVYDSEDVDKRLKNIDIQRWDCDIKQYAELSDEVSHD